MSKLPLVSIIIVNWNGGSIFKDCLKSLSGLKYPNAELIIVDNGSADGSQYYYQNLKLPFKSCKLIENNINVGFAPANNQGIPYSKGKYILLLNNDTKISPDFLKLMVGQMENDPTVGVMQPKLFLMDKTGLLDNCGSFLTPSGFLQHWGFYQKDGVKFNYDSEIFSAKGACLLTRKAIVKRIGLFDDNFVSYFEETDFCWRVWLLGFRVIYFPEAHIWHKLGVTSRKMNQIVVNYHSFKNRIASLFINLGTVNLFKILVPHLLIVTMLSLYYLVRWQWKKAWMLIAAVGWNLGHINGLMRQRLKVQGWRKVSDEQMFKKIMQTVSLGEMFSHFQKVEANFK